MTSKFYGTKKVFTFTFVQMLKSKSSVISMLLFFIFALLFLPIYTFFTSKSNDDISKVSTVKKIYFFNDTTFSELDFHQILKTDVHTNKITIENCNVNDFDKKSDFIENKEHTSILLKVYKTEDNYSLDFTKATSDDVKKDDVNYISTLCLSYFNNYKISTLNLDANTLKTVSKVPVTNVITDVDSLDTDDATADNSDINQAKYWIAYAIFAFILFVNTFSSSIVASNIATDKSSRIVEYLLTTVKPLALIIGKIIASVCFSLLEFGGTIICLLISNKFTNKFISEDTFINKYFNSDATVSLNASHIILFIIIILLGVIFYSILAGLTAATVSKIEDLKSGMQVYNIVLIISSYSAIFTLTNLSQGTNLSTFEKFIALFPTSSPFILPSLIVTGKMSEIFLFVSIGLLVVFCLLLAQFTAKIYHIIIVHNGSIIKPKELISIFKGGTKNE